MRKGSKSLRVLATVMSLLTLMGTAPFSLAETFASPPLGSIVTPGQVTVGNVVAPTGTTIFAGDRVATSDTPALISFTSGSRMELAKAAATFSRQGETLVVHASSGLLRFNFKKGEPVQINAGRYQFTSMGNGTAHEGELGLNQNGQLAMALTEGVFTAMNTVNGEAFEVSPSSPMMLLDQEGTGTVARGGKTLKDPPKAWKMNEMKGLCLVVGDEAFPILSNTGNTITINGVWKSANGSVPYKVVSCDRDSLIAAGASAGAAGAAAAGAAAVGAAAAGAGAVGGALAGTTIAVIGGVAAAAGVAAAVVVNQQDKSPSSR